MQKGDMNGIKIPLIALQVIAILKKLYGKDLVVGNREKLIIGNQWRLPRTQIGKDNPRTLLTWIGSQSDFPLVRATSRLSWLVQTISSDIIQPTVIDASQPSVLHTPITQVRPPMTAVYVQ
jgi:hypothetical protein